MSETTKLYDAAQVTLSLCGILIDSGFAEGAFLKITPSAADYVSVIGTDGMVTRCRTNNRHATVEIMVMQTADANGFLGALSNMGLLAANGSDIGALLVRDRLSGVCMYTAAECWIAKPPDVEYDLKATTRTWTCEVSELVRVDAGS